MKLFCFASAGSSTSMYNSLKDSLSEDIKLIPIELPGHGKRYREPLIPGIEQAAEDCLKQMRYGIEEPYALLGYSMGAWIAYEVYYAIKARNLRLPDHFFICSQEPPFAKHNNGDELLHKLPDDEFRVKMIGLGGIPEEIQKPDIFQIFLPIMKADYQIIEEYDNCIKKEKIHCDITVMYSDEDKAICRYPEEPLLWKEATTASAEFFNFKGGHFFIHSNIKSMAEIINRKLSLSGIYSLER